MKNFTRLTMPFILGCFLLNSCGNQQQPWGTDEPQAFPVMTVSVSDAILHEEFSSVIEGQQNVEIRPKVDGFIEKIYVDEGSSVSKGQILFKILAPQYDQEVKSAKAALESAEAAVSTASLQLRKTKPLVEKGIVNEFETEEATYHLHEKEALLSQAKASLANARTNISYTTILSPVDGIVGTIPFKAGSLVSSTIPQPLTTVSDIRKIYAYFSMDEKQFLDFLAKYPGNTMSEKVKKFPKVTLIMANGNIHPEMGSLETVSGLINTSTGTATFRAEFKNTGSLIRSGSTGTLRIDQHLKASIIIPQSATYEMQDKKFLYLVNKDGVVKSTQVKVNKLTYNQMYVVDSGLKVGDKIVSDGMGNLRDGMKIIPTHPSKMGIPQQQY